MNAIAALFTLLGRTITRQEAIIAALEKKGILSLDEINANLPKDEQTKAVVADLQKEFLALMKQFGSASGQTPQ